MKAGKTNIEVNSRVVLVQGKEEHYLGATGILLQPRHKESIGCLLLEHPEKYGVNMLELSSREKVIEIPDDNGEILAGKTDIPVNERVLLLVKDEELPISGYITHPFGNCKTDDTCEYIAGIRIESPKGVYANDICNAVEGDIIIRYPGSEEMNCTEDFYVERARNEGAVRSVQLEKITNTARVYCGWYSDGIYVDLDYEYHESEGATESELLFSEWCDEGSPSLDKFKEAVGIAKYARAKYNLPLVMYAEDNYEGYLLDVEREKITAAAQVVCTWDEDGIFVDLEYDKNESDDDAKAVACFYSLYADHEGCSYTDEQPSEKVWEYALKVAGFIKGTYKIPLKVDRSNKQGPETGYLKDSKVFQNSLDDICYITEGGESYTHHQILELCNNQEEIAEIVFDNCNWESPSTYLDQALCSGLMDICKNCGKIFITSEEQIDEIFCPECKNVCVDTPEGILVVGKKGTKDEYPGIYVSLKSKDSPFLMVEYDTVKECFQIVVYNNEETDFEPSDVIELQNIK